MVDSQLFAAKLKQFQDFFEQSQLNELLTLQNFQPSSPTANQENTTGDNCEFLLKIPISMKEDFKAGSIEFGIGVAK